MKFLVIIDMQNDFVTGSLKNESAQKIVDGIARKIKQYKEQSYQIIATLDTHYANSYSESQEGKRLPVAHCIYNTEGWDLYPTIGQAIQESNGWTFSKPSFGSLELTKFIQNIAGNFNQVEEIELCGTCTGICVISNAMILKAAFPEARIVVDSENCACLTPETHKTALKAMELCQIDIK